jgi:hypothetical protein
MLGPSSGRGLVSQYFGIFGQDIAQPLRYVSNVPLRNSLFFYSISLNALRPSRYACDPTADGSLHINARFLFEGA